MGPGRSSGTCPPLLLELCREQHQEGARTNSSGAGAQTGRLLLPGMRSFRARKTPDAAFASSDTPAAPESTAAQAHNNVLYRISVGAWGFTPSSG